MAEGKTKTLGGGWEYFIHYNCGSGHGGSGYDTPEEAALALIEDLLNRPDTDDQMPGESRIARISVIKELRLE